MVNVIGINEDADKLAGDPEVAVDGSDILHSVDGEAKFADSNLNDEVVTDSHWHRAGDCNPVRRAIKELCGEETPVFCRPRWQITYGPFAREPYLATTVCDWVGMRCLTRH